MPPPARLEKNPEKGYVALLGWSLAAVEALDKFDRRYLVVAPEWAEQYCTENNIPFLPWNFERLNDRSLEIAETLQDKGVDVAIPLYEETVECPAQSTRCCSVTLGCSVKPCSCATRR